MVRERLSWYNEMWNRFTDAHNTFMTVAKDDSEDQTDALRQYDRLIQERVTFCKVVDNYLQNAATFLNQQVMKDLVSRKVPVNTVREGSVTSRSTHSEFRRAEAMRAQLALQLAEQEKQRTMEAEMKLMALEKRQRDLARQREIEEEELDRTRRLESLRIRAESEIAEARGKAALTELEAKLAQADEERDQEGDILTYGWDPKQPPVAALGADPSVVSQAPKKGPEGATQTLPSTSPVTNEVLFSTAPPTFPVVSSGKAPVVGLTPLAPSQPLAPSNKPTQWKEFVESTPRIPPVATTYTPVRPSSSVGSGRSSHEEHFSDTTKTGLLARPATSTV